ncbi:MAG: hypothetical protein Unbinned1068contig1001_11 [Prokaryotic dsDNA virus sp.]|nr:MAG: hypothetical protein Unbinned1068contig1001_11 [Prokaryotic dsDNA virus sp.]
MGILCTKNPSTEMDVRMVPVPETTRSYTPMPHGDLIDTIDQQLKHHLPQYYIADKQYGLAREGQQLFGLMTLKKHSCDVIDAEIVEDDIDLSIGFRNSYDKSMSVGIVGGAKVFICDNMMMTSDAVKFMKRHTKNVLREFDYMLWTNLPELQGQFVTMKEAKAELCDVEIEHEQGYEFLGRMFGHKLLTPVQMSSATADWREPIYDVFKPRTAWSLYNAATWGLKKGSPSLAIQRYCNAHDWFMDQKDWLT